VLEAELSTNEVIVPNWYVGNMLVMTAFALPFITDAPLKTILIDLQSGNILGKLIGILYGRRDSPGKGRFNPTASWIASISLHLQEWTSTCLQHDDYLRALTSLQ